MKGKAIKKTVKGLQNTRQRIIPLANRNALMELGLLEREKMRFEAEESRLLEKLDSVQTRLAALSTEMIKLYGAISDRGFATIHKDSEDSKRTKKLRY